MNPKKSTIRTLREIYEEVYTKQEAIKLRQLEEVMETFRKELPRHRASLLEVVRFDIYPYGAEGRLALMIEQERLPTPVKDLLLRVGNEHKRVSDELTTVRSLRYNPDLLELLQKGEPELVERVEDSLQRTMREQIARLSKG